MKTKRFTFERSNTQEEAEDTLKLLVLVFITKFKKNHKQIKQNFWKDKKSISEKYY